MSANERPYMFLLLTFILVLFVNVNCAVDHFDYFSVTRNKFFDSNGIHKFVIRDHGLFSRSRRDLNLLDKMKLSEPINAETSHISSNQTVVHIPDRSVSLCTYSSINSRVNQCFQEHTNCR
jgi:hypothetical protein